MDTTAASDLDPAALGYFRGRYADLDDEEVAELAARRDSLADEAAAAVNEILAARGLSPAAVLAAAAPAPETPVEQQITLAKELWASPASRTGQFLCMASFLMCAGLLAKFVPIFGSSPGLAGLSALLRGMVVLGVGYAGYRFGRWRTREICANGDKPIAQRRRELRLFAALVFPVAFLVFALVRAVLPST